VDPETFRPRGDKDTDIVFVANILPAHPEGANRLALAHALADAGLTMDACGAGWGETATKSVRAHPPVHGSALAGVLAGARISLGWSRTDVHGCHSWPRMWASMASGCLYLVRYFPGLEDLFEAGEEIAWFETPGEAAALARHYLEHEDERARIAEAGRRRVLREHTWETHLGAMLDSLLGRSDWRGIDG
jgi:hypothetical protein